jgi:hypothetical protein
MQHIEEQRFQHIGGIIPSAKVEGLEAAEGKRVLGVVKQKPASEDRLLRQSVPQQG